MSVSSMISSSVNETNEIGVRKSLEMPITFTSQNSNVSPVIDLDRRSFIAVANRINNVDSSSDVFPTTILLLQQNQMVTKTLHLFN